MQNFSTIGFQITAFTFNMNLENQNVLKDKKFDELFKQFGFECISFVIYFFKTKKNTAYLVEKNLYLLHVSILPIKNGNISNNLLHETFNFSN